LVVGLSNIGQLGPSVARCVATLSVLVVAVSAFACREAAEPSVTATFEAPPVTRETPPDTDTPAMGSRAAVSGILASGPPALAPSPERSAGPAKPQVPKQTPRPPSIDSDAAVAADPDSEEKASKSANDTSGPEPGLSTDSTGRAAPDSDAYALSRD
jgi:hypothetical protein